MNNLVKLETVYLRRCVLQSSAVLRNPTCNGQTPDHQHRRQFSQNFWNSVSASAPVNFMQESLTQLHDLSGLPWWSTIIVSTVLLRGLVTFPLAIYQSKILAKVEKVSEEMPAIVKELKLETGLAIRKFNWTEKQAGMMYNRSLKKQFNNLLIRDNCHPAKAAIVVIFQIPLWVIQSWGIRNLIYVLPDPTSITAQLIASEMVVGGFGWIPNLTQVDHSWILPVTLGLLNLTIIEIQKMSRKIQINSKIGTYSTNFFRVLSVCMVPIAASVPSGLCLYWVSSSAFGLFQNLVLLSPKLKRLTNIPKVKSELEKPYAFLLDKIKARVGIGQ